MNQAKTDPRTKLGMLILCVLSATMGPNLWYIAGLMAVIAVLGIVWKQYRYIIKATIGAVLLLCLTWLTQEVLDFGNLRTMMNAFLGLVYQVYPCGMLAGLIIATTKVSQFMAAMNRLHISDKVVIPLAIMLRYLPAVREDWRYIKDAMSMRDVAPSLKGLFTRPGMTIECVYVPLMMNASKAADELSIAAVTRGIETPGMRTSYEQLHYRIGDALLLGVFLLYFASAFLIKGGIL